MPTEPNPVIEAAMEYARTPPVYKSMKQLGAMFGVSSHVVGRALKTLGLRDEEGHPTEQAKDGGFVKTAQFVEGIYFDVWHEEKTLNVLRPLIEQAQK